MTARPPIRAEDEAFEEMWDARPWDKRGPVDAILRLLEQGEITRGKAMELLYQRLRLFMTIRPAPWDRLNWCDADIPATPPPTPGGTMKGR